MALISEVTTFVKLSSVTLDYAVYSVRAKSLRNAVLNLAVGGRMFAAQNDLTIVRALTGLSFRLDPGDRLGLVGHNGSGKTSLLKVLAGIYEPTGGQMEVKGSVSSMISMSIGLDHEASGLQNIRNLLMMQMMSNQEIARRIPDIVDFSELGAYIHLPFKTYSAGMMARLTFAVATSTDADILIMDEWLGAGDAEFQAKAAGRMAGVVDNANIVVVASHDMNLIERVCNKVLVLEAGRSVFFGATSDWDRQVASS